MPYVGEIRLFAGNFAPAGWSFCSGQVLPIGEHEILFTLIGTTYGGDGASTFALPDLRGRAPLHSGAGGGGNYVLSQRGGTEEVTLTPNQMPVHTHTPVGSSAAGTTAVPSAGVWSTWSDTPYGEAKPVEQLVAMSPTALSTVGGSQAHENMPPYLAINFIISLYGVYPSPA